MHIERINENKIKVLISKDDLREWNVDINSFTQNTPEAQNAVWSVLRQAEREVDFASGGSQLVVETIPASPDGFVMFITRMTEGIDNLKSMKMRLKPVEARARKKTNFCESAVSIFKFQDFEAAVGASKSVVRSYVGRSSLHKYKDSFYIIFKPYDMMTFFEVENTLVEYADKLHNAQVTQGSLNEYGTAMIEEDAIYMLSNFE